MCCAWRTSPPDAAAETLKRRRPSPRPVGHVDQRKIAAFAKPRPGVQIPPCPLRDQTPRGLDTTGSESDRFARRTLAPASCQNRGSETVRPAPGAALAGSERGDYDRGTTCLFPLSDGWPILLPRAEPNEATLATRCPGKQSDLPLVVGRKVGRSGRVTPMALWELGRPIGIPVIEVKVPGFDSVTAARARAWGSAFEWCPHTAWKSDA